MSYFLLCHPRNMESRKWTLTYISRNKKNILSQITLWTYTIAIGENNHVVIISKLIDALRFETLGQIVDPFRPRYHDMYAPRF